jgi:hypothetical protein
MIVLIMILLTLGLVIGVACLFRLVIEMLRLLELKKSKQGE